jgi:dipeptidyl aminopeptidase/acylaminoacyl peptidase
MPQPITAPYGSWKSPITSDTLVSETVGLSEPRFDGKDLYWLESRPSEKGRTVIVRRAADGTISDCLPSGFNARSRVHEYGGGAYTIDTGVVFFVSFEDQRIYGTKPGSDSIAITPESTRRYADLHVDRKRNRLICICEDHRDDLSEPENSIVAVDMDGSGSIQTLVSGHDFYSTARVSPDGSRIAWLSWDHPNMPWDGTELWIADMQDDGTLGEPQKIAGGKNESIFQPSWSPDGILHFVSDRSGWWNLYRYIDDSAKPLCMMEAEFGQPQWVFGMSTYGFLSSGEIICAYSKDARWHPARIEPGTGKLGDIDMLYSSDEMVASDRMAAFVCASTTEGSRIIVLDLASGKSETVITSGRIDIDPGYISEPTMISYPTSDDGFAHALFYPPRNKDYVGPQDDRPPLRVISHGGPTSVSAATLELSIQYWTSRGFGVLDVNYRGSTGYGRDYRRQLNGKWGIYDVDDCMYGALYLADRNEIDRSRLIIRGGSAGGYTTLCALTFRNEFKAGASYYGIGDLETLARDTHKFESRYLDSMVGPYPERKDIYKERSPIHYVDQLNSPVIFFQGLNDRVVLPNQAETMVETIRAKGLPVAYVPFEGEGHGFRSAENIKRAIDAELYFYSRIFGFTPADDIDPVEIDNLD